MYITRAANTLPFGPFGPFGLIIPPALLSRSAPLSANRLKGHCRNRFYLATNFF